MEFFRKNSGLAALMAAAACLFGYIIWQFVLGGSSLIQTEFTPVNDQMQQMIAQQQAPSSSKPSLGKPPSSPSSVSSHSPSPSMDPKFDASSSEKSVLQSSMVPTSTPEKIDKPAIKEERLDLNMATVEQLVALPGIGASKAKAILDYRKQKGKFRRVEELVEVKGIGEKMLAKLKPLVYVAEP